ncbi:MAG: DUF4337 domain-containing protein [Burkholderiaceae bacterium]|nr:MAG: DUF4337 domain-containing protein [Burkholderiaceae bacterium]
MSDDHFHVHGPHDHAVEHAAHGSDDFSGSIAVMTAILATVGAFFSYQGGLTQNTAMLFKNEAAIRKTEASDKWNFYQAKSNKQNLAELALTLTPAKAEFYQGEIERYKKEKEDIKKDAEKLEAASLEANQESDEQMHQHHRWAQATTAIQIAISLAAITLLTRRRWLQVGCYAVSGIGGVLAVLALLHI